MDGRYREGDHLLGIAGLALLRAGAQRRLDAVGRHAAEIATIARRLEEPAYARRRDLPEYGVQAGYAGWAERYDDPGNDTIGLEQPLVRALLDDLPAGGPVLDAACGTGRHAAYLAGIGREVIGVDSSEEMLARARAKLPQADLRAGDLAALPVAGGSCAGAVCALALSHLDQLGPPVAELARVLRPGGRLVISNPHPFATGVLGWRAVFVDAAGARRMIPEYAHLHGDYVEALTAAGLVVRRLLEPGLTRRQARARAKGDHAEAFEEALTGVPAVIVWEAERPA
jgi:SAM-dependent methyltransferase